MSTEHGVFGLVGCLIFLMDVSLTRLDIAYHLSEVFSSEFAGVIGSLENVLVEMDRRTI